jgi:lysophospholipase L1-like esterase
MSSKNKKPFITSLASIVLGVLVFAGVECGFRLYLKVFGKDVISILPTQELLDKAWFRPHPQLIYVFKADSTFTMTEPPYGHFTINGFGFRSTLDLDLKQRQKRPDTIRIATLGGSTTMGVNDDDKIWPYLLGRRLSALFPGKSIEVLNEGIMGYTSLDNLLDLSMRVIDFNCDVYILYLGVNDLLAAAPLDVYKTDYSHFRRTLYERLYAVALLPSWLLHLKSFRAVLQACGVPDSRDLLANTGTGQFRRAFDVFDQLFRPAQAASASSNPSDNTTSQKKQQIEAAIRQSVIRNIRSMLGIIRMHNPQAITILSSFYMRRELQIIKDLNADIANLARENGLVLADPANRLPRDPSIVYDNCHFTPHGDNLMSETMAQSVLSAGLRLH